MTAQEINAVQFAFQREHRRVSTNSFCQAPSTLIKIRDCSRKSERFRNSTVLHKHKEEVAHVNVFDARYGAPRSTQIQRSANLTFWGIGAEHEHLIPRKIADVSHVHLGRPIPKLLSDVVNYAAVPPAPHESEGEKNQCRIAAKDNTHGAEFRRSMALWQGQLLRRRLRALRIGRFWSDHRRAIDGEVPPAFSFGGGTERTPIRRSRCSH